MPQPKRVVLFAETDAEIPEGSLPLMLEPLHGRSALARCSEALLQNGAEQILVVAGPRFASSIRAWFPAEANVTVSEQSEALSALIDTDEPVFVLPRAALPMPSVGAGFAYAASGRDLQDAWRVRLTNAVQGAELIGGWLPIFNRDTLAEYEALLSTTER